MALPDLSNSLYVAQLRHIQAIREPPESRNPDYLVRYFLPFRQRFSSAWLRSEELTELRRDPFYYYLLARTRFYDGIFRDSIEAGVRRIVSVGCGSDTRPYRFKQLLVDSGARVMECDQADAIFAKRRIARRWRSPSVEYMPIDLNDDSWPELKRWLLACSGDGLLIMMEGVSPYIEHDKFRAFLKLVGDAAVPGSQVVYDFKLQGVKDAFGRSDRARTPFRLPGERQAVTNFHEPLRLELRRFDLSTDLYHQFLPQQRDLTLPRFDEDGVLQLRVA